MRLVSNMSIYLTALPMTRKKEPDQLVMYRASIRDEREKSKRICTSHFRYPFTGADSEHNSHILLDNALSLEYIAFRWSLTALDPDWALFGHSMVTGGEGHPVMCSMILPRTSLLLQDFVRLSRDLVEGSEAGVC